MKNIKKCEKGLILFIFTISIIIGFAQIIDAKSEQCSLKITKLESDEQKRPIKGVGFTIYKTLDNETQTEVKDYMVKIEDEKITSDNGVVIFNNLEIGRYLVTETTNPNEMIQKASNFLVDLPQYTYDTDKIQLKEIYDVEVFPKNTLGFAQVSITSHILKDMTKNDPYLSGVEFSLKYLKDGSYIDISNLNNANGTIPQKPISLITPDGISTINISNLPVGNYRFEVQKVPDRYIKNTDPIDFSVVNYDGRVFASDNKEDINPIEKTDYHVYLSKPDIKLTSNISSQSISINDNIKYDVTVSIPKNEIEKLETFAIINTYGKDLEVDITSLVIISDGEIILDNCYNVIDEDNNLKIEFNEIGKKYLATKDSIDIIYDSKVVSVDNFLNEDKDSLNNVAKVIYSNQTNGNSQVIEKYFEIESNNIKYETYSAYFIKKDGSLLAKNKYLKGASFKILKSLEDNVYENSISAFDGNKITNTYISDENGNFKIEGLEQGIYYLFEIDTPTIEEDGKIIEFSKLDKPIKFNVDSSNDKNNPIEIINYRKFQVPNTGSIGIIFIFGSILLIVIGSTILIFNRKNVKKK